MNLNSIEHLIINSKQAIDISMNYFPNVTELTLKSYFKTFDKLLSTTINRILPLKQLKKLFIKDYDFPFDEIIKFYTEFTYIKY